MKCQYESEILYKLMERDGFNIPSSVPPYEAEIKSYLINQVKQAYPKLTDYEAEWLLYNYTKHLPADFPISSATNVVKATFENVVPFAYQNAILKGQTLVNIFDVTLPSEIRNTHDITISYQVGGNETYTFIVEAESTSEKYQGGFITANGLGNGWNGSINNGITKFTVTTSEPSNKVRFSAIGASNTVQIKKCMIIKGDYSNQDIPFFTGMQSVKMPGLTTTGKNLCGVMEYGTISSADSSLTPSDTRIRSKDFITLGPGSYTISVGVNYEVIYRIYDMDGVYLSPSTSWERVRALEITETSKVKIVVRKNTDDKLSLTENFEIQIEKGANATTYEPYKSNILTVNEEVELRGIGDIRDELDLLTCELTQRIGEIVLDGSENWNFGTTKELTQVFETKISTARDETYQINSLGLPNGTNGKDIEAVIFIDNGLFYISLLKTKASTVEELKTYLSQNPITVQYELATESIKTVDLTAVNEKGETTYFMPLEGTMNVQSSGEIIQPTFDMSVPVEATTQNLASFIELEME